MSRSFAECTREHIYQTLLSQYIVHWNHPPGNLDKKLLASSTIVFPWQRVHPSSSPEHDIGKCVGTQGPLSSSCFKLSSLLPSLPALVLPFREMASLYSLENHRTNCNFYLSKIVSTPRPCGVTRRKGFELLSLKSLSHYSLGSPVLLLYTHSSNPLSVFLASVCEKSNCKSRRGAQCLG